MAKRQRRTSTKKQDEPRELYEPLPPGKYFRFRILVLQPGSGDDKIRCHLAVRTLKRSKRTYEAISYVWGDAKDTVDVECNGVTVPITVNLADALRQFRNHRRTRRLWADALCINQADDQEKGLQVSQMGRIFKSAKRVLVWLGPDDEGMAEDCFFFISKVNKYLDIEYLRCGRRFDWMPSQVSPLPMAIDEKHYRSLTALMTRPWFWRVWTVQESAMARHCRVYWGPCYMSIADIVEFTFWSSDIPVLRPLTWTSNGSAAYKLSAIYAHLHGCYKSKGSWHHSRPRYKYHVREFSGTRFANIVYGGRLLDATDPRDHVYAFLGSSYARDHSNKLFIEADYTVPVDEAYYRPAHSLLQYSREGPWLLSSVAHNNREEIFAPESTWSWIPQWNTNAETERLAHPTFGYIAGGPSDMFKPNSISYGCMGVPGFVFDTLLFKTAPLSRISELSPATKEENMTIETEVDILWRVVLAQAEKRGLHVDFNSFILTLYRGYFGKEPYRDPRIDHEAFRKVLLSRTEEASRIGIEHLTDNDTIVASWVSDYLRTLWKHSLFITEHGRMGLASSKLTRVGDVCCIFLGATVPFILAPLNNKRYKLVCDSYVQGVMEGEILDKFEAQVIELE